MVDDQLVARGIADQRVLDAFRAVPREEFVGEAMTPLAYRDRALPIDADQTISQPYVVALMLEALELRGIERALDVGTGSGYAAALLSLLAAEVHSIERIPSLAADARRRLDRLGYAVVVHEGDGTLGLPEHAPFDAVMVGAGGPRVPDALVSQLAPGGRLVIPVADDGRQLLVRVIKIPGDGLAREVLDEVRFVPLIGAQGEPEPRSAPPSASSGGPR
jgi:protein-L-isoaspartate(D-aspartate) O-methyltransferase